MKSLKDRIMKHHFAIPKDVRNKMIPYVDFRESTFITGIEKIPYSNGVVLANERWGDLIFEDFVAVMPNEGKQLNGEVIQSPYGLLVRVFRKDEDIVSGCISVFFTDGELKNCYLVMCGIDLHIHEGTIELVHVAEINSKFVNENREQFFEEFLKTIYVTQRYEQTVVRGVPKKYSYQKMTKAQQKTHIEYIVDLTKPKYVSEPKESKATGKRKEYHERKGYKRTSKLGKVHWVRSSEINKDLKPEIKKDKTYKLG